MKDASEPITGNLAERIAFLIGQGLEERKQIVHDTRKTYAMRSKFIHHGQKIEDVEVFERFLHNAWTAISSLVSLRDQVKTRQELITILEDRKLS